MDACTSASNGSPLLGGLSDCGCACHEQTRLADRMQALVSQFGLEACQQSLEDLAASPKKKAKSGFTHVDFLPFNQLKHPVWVFDFDTKTMYWANTAAVELWNAEDLPQLLARDFTDMSQATAQRLESYLPNLRRGGCESEQWTIHPQGVPTTLNLNISAVYCGPNSRMLMLKEGDMPRPKEELDEQALRRVEILRHLPLAVAQFDDQGKLMEQNPQASAAFGGTNSTGPSLVERFVTTSQGQEYLQTILNNSQQQCRLEAQLNTTQFSDDDDNHVQEENRRWFALKAGCRKDPITSQNVILLSAQDITAMRQAQLEAARADREKSEFLAVMAHEIRTPLHQVIGFGELLLAQGSSLTQQQREYVQLLESSSKALMTVINDTLDYTKLEAGEMKLESISFEVQEVIAGVAFAISPKCKSKGLQMTHHACKEVPNVVMGDPTRLRQILLNLTHNAMKFTQRGSITLDVQRLHNRDADTSNDASTTCNNGYWLRFEVRDTGVGISPNNLPKLFRKYQQAGADTARKYGGTGLGLAICDLLVKAMGGRLGVTSVLGKGTTFWLELPYARVCNKSIARSTEAENNKVTASVGLNILIVEDNTVNQKLAAAMLKRLGHHSTVACDGLVALQKIEKSKYDLVLMDVQMPVMDGLTATKKLRQEMKLDCSALPIIGLTADFRKADLPKYMDVGMNDCIGKPVRLAELKGTIQSVMEASGWHPNAPTTIRSRAPQYFDSSKEPKATVEVR